MQIKIKYDSIFSPMNLVNMNKNVILLYGPEAKMVFSKGK